MRCGDMSVYHDILARLAEDGRRERAEWARRAAVADLPLLRRIIDRPVIPPGADNSLESRWVRMAALLRSAPEHKRRELAVLVRRARWFNAAGGAASRRTARLVLLQAAQVRRQLLTLLRPTDRPNGVHR